MVLTFILPEPSSLDLYDKTNYTKWAGNTESMVGIKEETFAKEPSITPDT